MNIMQENEQNRSLDNMICTAEKKKEKFAAGKSSQEQFLTLFAHDNGTWSAKIGPAENLNAGVPMVMEQDYPVQLIYGRIDINGSTNMDAIECEGRSSLLDAMNWLGSCGFPPIQIWDFDIDTAPDHAVMDIIHGGMKYRYERVTQVMEEMSQMEEEANMNVEPKRTEAAPRGHADERLSR